MHSRRLIQRGNQIVLPVFYLARLAFFVYISQGVGKHFQCATI